MAEQIPLSELLASWIERRNQGEDLDLDELLEDLGKSSSELAQGAHALHALEQALADERQPSQPLPEVLGDYRILREVGRGGMGVVYEAEQVSMGRRVALKVLTPSLTGTRRSVQRFVREAKAAGSLHHTCIVPVYGMGQQDGYWYYAMELVEGRPLSAVLTELRGTRAGARTQRWLEVTSGSRSRADAREAPPGATTPGSADDAWYRRVAELFAGLAEALHVAHQAGVIHRDIKPGNLLLDADGSLKIVDFGLAHLDEPGPAMTLSGDLLGTPAYMSPEQARAKSVPVDHRTDVYSLGATLYEVLALRPPFSGRTLQELCWQITSEEPEAPRRLDQSIPRDLETIVLKAMEKERERRYPHSADLALDLRRFAHGAPIAARRPTPLYRLSRFARRNRVFLGGVAAVVAALTAGLIGMTHKAREAEAARSDMERAVAVQAAVVDFVDRMLTWFGPAERDMTVREMIDRASAEIGDAYPGEPLVEAEVRDMIQSTYQRLGAYAQATEHGRARVQLLIDALGPEDPRVLDAKEELALHLSGQDEHREAGSLYRELVESRSRTLGGDAGATLVARNRLGLCLWSQGRFAAAEKTLQDAVERGKRVLAPSSRLLGGMVNNLAMVYQDLGRHDEAIELYQETLEVEQRERPDGEDLLFTLSNLAWSLETLDPAQAEPIYRQVLEGMTRKKGPVHPHTVQARDLLASCLRKMGCTEEAEALFRAALESAQSELAADDPVLIDVMNDLAVLLIGSGRPAEAEPLLREVVAVRRRRDGNEAPSTHVSIHNLAHALWLAGQREEAQALFEEALWGLESTLGPDDERTVETRELYESLLRGEQ